MYVCVCVCAMCVSGTMCGAMYVCAGVVVVVVGAVGCTCV